MPLITQSFHVIVCNVIIFVCLFVFFHSNAKSNYCTISMHLLIIVTALSMSQTGTKIRQDTPKMCLIFVLNNYAETNLPSQFTITIKLLNAKISS